MVKFQFLEQFLVDPLSHPVVSSLILLFLKFASFTYYMIIIIIIIDIIFSL